MDRRLFLRLSAGSAVGAACLAPLGLRGCEPSGREDGGVAVRRAYERSAGGAGEPSAGNAGVSSAGPSPLERPGLQLYTVRGLMADDVARTLELVSAIGYREVEFAGYFGRAPAVIRRLVDEFGLSASSAHVSLPQLRDGLDALLDAATTVGHRFLVLPSLPDEVYESLDRFRGLCAELNEIGETCLAAGVRFAYHNHAIEFEPVEGRVPYDVMLEECAPELVAMQVDFFWMRAGGRDPLEYFDSHPGRFPLCHVKDMAADGSMVDVGQGTIDWAAIFARADRAGLEHYFVEHDQPRDPVWSISRSYEYLTGPFE